RDVHVTGVQTCALPISPQAVINGRIHVNGANRHAVSATLKTLDREGEGLTVDLRVSHSGDSVIIDAGSSATGKGNAHVVLVYFEIGRASCREGGCVAVL